MRTLFLSYAYPPARFPRAIQVARLARHSDLDDLSVVAADDEADAVDESLLSTAPEGVSVERLRWDRRARAARALRDRTIRGRALLPDPFRPWAREAARHVLATGLGKGDVLVTFGQPMSDHLAGHAVARRSSARWIAHFSDPWVDNPFSTQSAPVRALNRRLERRVISSCDACVFTSQETADLVMRKYPAGWRRKASVLPHAYDPDLYPEGGGGRGAPLILRYVGNFYGPRTAEPLLAGLVRLAETEPAATEDLRVEFVGATHADPREAPSASRLPDGMVGVLPPVPYLESLELMRSADLLALVDAPAERSVFLPSKLVEYLGARRPIVAVTPPGPAARLTLDAGGWQADPADPDAVAGALAAAIDSARGARPEWGEETVIGRYAALDVAARLDRLVGEVAA